MSRVVPMVRVVPIARRGAVIVAGGESRRMGRRKEWLELAGEPLLTRVARIVASRCELVIVAAAADQALPPLASGTRRVDDPAPLRGRGPVVGLAQGLIALEEAGIELAYLGSCDAARLSGEHVAYMLDRLERGRAAGVIVGGDEGWPRHPLASAVRVGPARRALAQMVAEGERRARELFERLAPVDVVALAELPDAAVVEPLNEPHEWEALLRG